MRQIGVAVVVMLLSVSTFAQNNRSAVSLTGNDLASCTVPDPCRTFDVAISKTNSGGEVIVLSSAGYGPFTVTKAVSIISPPAYHAAIAPTSGDAITINVDNALIVVRGLTLNGALGGTNGITFTGATTVSNTTLYIENCAISGFGFNGVNFARNGVLFVSDTTVRQSSNAGIYVNGNTGLPSHAMINHALLEANNTAGILVDNAIVTIRDSVAAGSVQGEGFWARASINGTTADLSADNCAATNNGDTGFAAGGGGGSARLAVSNSVASSNVSGIYSAINGIVRASHNSVMLNGTGLVQASGVFESAGNNAVRGNSANTSGTITPFTPI